MKTLIALTALAAASITSSPAQARSATASFGLSARVESFCRIEGGQSDALSIQPVTALGSVREVCNTQGYVVRASFTNLSGGTVVAGNDQAGIAGGMAEFRYAQAQALVRSWLLRDPVQFDTAAPVYFTVSITPL